MCQYNNIVLSGNVNFEEITKVFRQYGFMPNQIHNNSLAEQLEDKIFIISPKNQCDCGSVIASKGYKDIPVLQNTREFDKLKSKGWSETKINNYFANKAKADLNKTDDKETERIRWGKLIKEIFVSPKMHSFGILVHDYKKDVDTEKITIKARNKINLTEFSPEQLDTFIKDVYYEIQS